MKRLFILLPLILLAAGCVKQASAPAPAQKGKAMITISSSSFSNGGIIPEKYSCKGENVNPELDISDVPDTAKSLALIMHDPDAPREGGFTHWVLYNMDPNVTSIAENSVPQGAVQGSNGSGEAQYTGPCPPSGTHRYYFTVYALDTVLQSGIPLTKTELEKAMQGHVLSQDEIMGTFSH